MDEGLDIKNVLGTKLQPCCYEPKTGFYRDGFCRTGDEDVGTHVVCAVITVEFLIFSKQQGNDLSTPIPLYHIPVLKPGDKRCFCAARWKQAWKVGKAPDLILEATHEKALQIIDFEILLEHKYAM